MFKHPFDATLFKTRLDMRQGAGTFGLMPLRDALQCMRNVPTTMAQAIRTREARRVKQILLTVVARVRVGRR